MADRTQMMFDNPTSIENDVRLIKREEASRGIRPALIDSLIWHHSIMVKSFYHA